MSVFLADLWLHVARVNRSLLVGDMRLVRVAMAAASFYQVRFLLDGTPKLDDAGCEILRFIFRDEAVLIALFAAHGVGMVRQVWRMQERPRIDFAANLLGAWLFGLVAGSVDISLERGTILAGLWYVMAALACWGTVRSGNGNDGAIL